MVQWLAWIFRLANLWTLPWRASTTRSVFSEIAWHPVQASHPTFCYATNCSRPDKWEGKVDPDQAWTVLTMVCNGLGVGSHVHQEKRYQCREAWRSISMFISKLGRYGLGIENTGLPTHPCLGAPCVAYLSIRDVPHLKLSVPTPNSKKFSVEPRHHSVARIFCLTATHRDRKEWHPTTVTTPWTASRTTHRPMFCLDTRLKSPMAR